MFWRVGVKRHPFAWTMQNLWTFVKMLKITKFHGIYVKFSVFYENAEPVLPNAQILDVTLAARNV